MKRPADMPAPEPRHEVRNEGIRTLLSMFDHGDPEETLRLRDILGDLRQGGFGVFLFVAILPAFIPIPGVGGAISGPLTILIGLQMMFGMRKPWMPDFIGNRGPRRATGQRFVNKIAPLLRWLDRLLKPRLQVLIEPLPAHAFTGLLLVATGVLLWLPTPFTNYLFGVILLMFALALLERDGVLVALCWAAVIACLVVFGAAAEQIVDMLDGSWQWLRQWWAGLG
ncbi:MAG TPA: exopolysaccharide biosynthesis protein [Stenotrophomonas sp.]